MKPTDAERDPAFDRLIARGLAEETDASGAACPDADLLAAWYDHSLSPSEAGRIETHVSSCGTCQQILGDLARSEPEVRRAAPLPASPRPWHWHWRWLVPLATAAVVVVVAGRTLRAPGEAPAATVVRPELQQAVATTADLQKKSAADAEPGGRKEGELERAAPSAPAATAQASRQDRPPALVDRMAEAVPPSVAVPSKPAGAKGEARPVGGVAGEGVGGVAKGRGERTAENVAAAAPVSALSAARQVAVARTAAALPHSTSASGPGGTMVTWRYGQEGVIERSIDRGQTWERQQSGVTTALVDGSAATDRVCWIVGERGLVLRTTDGRTWQRLSSPTPLDLVSVYAWSEANARVTASDRSEYETADGGRSWRRREPARLLLP